MRRNIKELAKYSINEPLFASFLQKQGVYSQLLYHYVKNNWLEAVSNGVYKRPGGKLDRVLIVRNLQIQLGLPIHICARSALLMHGVNHFGRTTDKLQVAMQGSYRPTKWLRSLKEIDFIRLNIFTNKDIGLEKIDNVTVSGRELAFIELAELVPKKVSYEEFFKTLELVPNLRGNILQQLLENCTSNKAKKIFLATAEQLNYQWYAKLNIARIKFGTGILQLVKAGVYNPKYKIYLEQING